MKYMDGSRPDPDQLLALINSETERIGAGRLKVFLGMVAGVGKTCAMLQAAHQLRDQGIEAVIGIVETHGRKGTAELVQGLEAIPLRKLVHRGIHLHEMDIDAILKRQPKVVLVDELAHNNVPGSRHSKRYLDVIELLRAGIDVYTTLNVQHLESRAGTVREITGVNIGETIPDSVLDQADEIILIDIAPDDLLRRLRAGVIYPKERAETAAQNFFSKVNLTALREISLRLAAERVDRELRTFKVMHGIQHVWKSGSRLLVAIYASPYSEALIRCTRRLADSMGATWLGVHVWDDAALSEEETRLLTKNMNLATQLGAEVMTMRDSDPVVGLLRAARQNNVTQIIVGKSQRPWWRDILNGGSVVNRLMRRSGAIDIYAVAPEGLRSEALPQGPVLQGAILPSLEESGWTVMIALVTWFLAAGLAPIIGYLAVGIIFLLAVSLAGLFLTRASILVLATLFGLIHNFFFVPPTGSISVSKPEDFLTLVMFFVAASTIGHLTSRLKRKEHILQIREARAMALYNLAREMASAKSPDEVAECAVRHLDAVFGTESAVIFAEGGAKPELLMFRGSSFQVPDKELAVAQWVVLHATRAGRHTDTLPASEGIYFPIVGHGDCVGVLALRVAKRKSFTFDDAILFETFGRQLAAGLEREAFHQIEKKVAVLSKAESLYRALLDSVSHELKTPLTAIKGSASALLDAHSFGSPGAVQGLASEVLTATERLQRLVDNLLDMTRIEAGMLRPKRELFDAEDIIGTVLQRLAPEYAQRPLLISVQPHLPPVLCDQVLLVQALANIVHNAMVYSPPSTAIEITATQENPQNVLFTIRDHGPGLPPENPAAVLAKFYRHAPEHSGGLGLGLSIAQGFVSAQGGVLSAANHRDGGAVFIVSMPCGDLHEPG